MNDYALSVLKDHYDHVKSIYKNNVIVGTFLHGSQNYQLHTEKSDVDSKTLLLPSISDVVNVDKKIISNQHVVDSKVSDHIDVKDIRLFFKEVWKQNPNTLEILFTDHFVLSDSAECEEFWSSILIHRERIARYNVYRAFDSIIGLTHRKRSFLTKSTESTEKEIKEYGYRRKELYHLFRLADFVEKYAKGLPYKDCLVPYNKERILRIKKEHVFPKEKVEKVADSFLEMIKGRVDFYKQDNENVVDEGVKDVVESLLEKFFLKKIFCKDANL